MQTAISRGLPWSGHRRAARAAQRGDPDHHGRRHHDRQPDRPVGDRRDGVRSQRPRGLPGAGGGEQGLRRGPGHQPGAGRPPSSSPTWSSTSPTRSSTRVSRSGAVPNEHRVLDPSRWSPESAPTRQPAHDCASTGLIGWLSVAAIVASALAAWRSSARSCAPSTPTPPTLSYANVGPIGGHLLGFDGAGRDPVSRLMVGARTTLLGAAFVAMVAVFDRLEPGRRDRPGSAAASTGRLGRPRRAVRLPRHPARRPRRRRVRRGPVLGRARARRSPTRRTSPGCCAGPR